MTLILVTVGRDSVFVAADTRSSKAITGTALLGETKKLHFLAGPILAASSGFGSSVSRDLFPAVHAIQDTQGSAGDPDFIDGWVQRIGSPIYTLGAEILAGLGGADPELIAVVAGVGLAGPTATIHRFATGHRERLSPGMFSALGTDTSVLKGMADQLATSCIKSDALQADLWTFRTFKAAALQFPESIGFPVDFGLAERGSGYQGRFENPDVEPAPNPNLLIKF